VPVIEQAIRQSQKIVFEVDPKEGAVFATKLRGDTNRLYAIHAKEMKEAPTV